MRHLLLLCLLFFTNLISFAQDFQLKNRLYELESAVISGDRGALEKLAANLDDTTRVIEMLGYHVIDTKVRNITMRILEENCLFTNEEFLFDSSITAASFLQFLRRNPVAFDSLTQMFLITPLSQLAIPYQLKILPEAEVKQAGKNLMLPPYPDWYPAAVIDTLLYKKNAAVLLRLAAAWFHSRSRFNRYSYHDKEMLAYIKRLTHLDIGVPDEDGSYTFLYERDYSAVAKRNLLTYFVHHYRDYVWDDKSGFFVNIREYPQIKSVAETLFPVLRSEDDSLALDAFRRLSEMDTGIVTAMSREYEKSFMQANFELPTFPFRFLPVLAQLTSYCRDNGFVYRAEGWLADALKQLETDIPFSERYRLEDLIISKLTPEEVTAVEYFGLLKNYFAETFSLGRILDKFYSRHLDQIAGDPRLLTLYLKKACLFKQLRIIGICNKYLRKFAQCTPEVVEKLRQLRQSSNDSIIRQQCQQALALHHNWLEPRIAGFRSWSGHEEDKLPNYTAAYKKIQATIKDKDKRRIAIQTLTGKISYRQLGEAIRILQKDTSMSLYDRFHFIESDFGFAIKLSEDSINRFLVNYLQKSEYELCKHYLLQMGLPCFNDKGSLDLPAAYEILKYDVVDGFVGGGGGRRDDGVYLVIKLLQLQFKTRWEFPAKACNWKGSYACDCTDEATVWRYYLRDRKLVDPDNNEPISISTNY